jgi:sugar phosphate isomerase/epimerase
LRKWRLSVSLDEFKAVRKKFDVAGINLYAFNYSFRDNFTDEEIERGFKIAQAMGVKIITASSNVSTAKRVDPFAKKYKIRVGMHNHSNIRPNEFATPDDFAAAMNGTSEYICINLDIGHFTAANFDAVDYLSKNASRIVTLHIKDRKKNQGENVSFGEGDTPIKAVLELLKKNKWKIPANIEYEYKGADTVAEMKKCLAYCKQALGA